MAVQEIIRTMCLVKGFGFCYIWMVLKNKARVSWKKGLEMSCCRSGHSCTKSVRGCTVTLLRINYHAWTFACRGIFFSNLA